MFFPEKAALFILPKQCESQSPLRDLLRMNIWALFSVLVLIISFSRMSTLERFHCQLTVAGEKESSKSKSALPRTCQENKKLKPEALSPRVSSCFGPQHLAGSYLTLHRSPWWVSSRPWSPDLSGADICSLVFRDHPEGSQRTLGLPANLQKGQESLAPTSSLKASQGDPVERSS